MYGYLVTVRCCAKIQARSPNDELYRSVMRAQARQRREWYGCAFWNAGKDRRLPSRIRSACSLLNWLSRMAGTGCVVYQPDALR